MYYFYIIKLKQTIMETLRNEIEKDNNMIFDIALYKRFSSIGDSCYAEICGNYIDGAIQWSQHNVYDIIECQNAKYTGWTVRFGSYGEIEKKVYIENKILDIVPKDWKHAKNLFSKFLKEKV